MTAAVTSDAGYILVLGSTRRKLQRNGNLFRKYHWKMLSCLLPNFDSMTWTNWFPSADIYNVSIFGTFATRTALHMTSFWKYKSARFFVLLLFTTGPCWSCPQRSGWGHRWSWKKVEKSNDDWLWWSDCHCFWWWWWLVIVKLLRRNLKELTFWSCTSHWADPPPPGLMNKWWHNNNNNNKEEM